MRLVGRWSAQSLRLVLALGLGLLAMQLPPLAHQYEAALLQVAESGRRDIEQRKLAARQFYPAAGETDEQVITALMAVEPSNAQALRVSVARVAAVAAAHARVSGAAGALRPMVAAADAADDPTGEKQAVLRSTLATYALQIALTGEALLYAVAGLLLGALVAELVAAGVGAATGVRPGAVQPTRR